MNIKFIKISVFWTLEEAESVYEFLDELKERIWQAYGQEIEQKYENLYQEQLEMEREYEPNDDVPR